MVSCPPEISDALQVTGIIRETNSKAAILRNRLTTSEEVVFQGQDVLSRAVLRDVTSQGAVLELKGSEKSCTLFFRSNGGSSTTPSTNTDYPSIGVDSPTFVNPFVVKLAPNSASKTNASPSAALDAFCQPPGDLAEAIGLSPFHVTKQLENGEQGLALDFIPPNSLLSALEVPKGAVLAQVNGFKVHSRGQVVDALLGVSDRPVTIGYYDHGALVERTVFVH